MNKPADNALLTPTVPYWINNRKVYPERLQRGIFGLSNALLNTPWPKVQALKGRLALVSKWMTCPRACTPASVRPAPTGDTGWRTTRSIASRRSPITVRTPSASAKPWKAPPW